jgi:hypothetical protein
MGLNEATNYPYTPELKAVEKFIRAHKSYVRDELSKGS